MGDGWFEKEHKLDDLDYRKKCAEQTIEQIILFSVDEENKYDIEGSINLTGSILTYFIRKLAEFDSHFENLLTLTKEFNDKYVEAYHMSFQNSLKEAIRKDNE